MDKIIKIWPLIFLIGNIGEQTFMFMHYASIIFYGMLALSIPLLLLNKDVITSSDCISSFRFMYIFISILLIYQFTFGLIVYNDRSWVYLLSKTISTAIIIISCYLCPEFNTKTLLIVFTYIIVAFTLIGHFVFNISYNNRATLGFLNPNSMGMLAALAFGILLIVFNFESRHRWINVFCMIELLISVLQSGSRNALGIIILAFLFRFGCNLKYLLGIAISFIILISVANELGFETSAFDRFVNTIENKDISEGRENERKAAFVMIKENPITGSGLYATQSEESLKISQYGSHNGYLDFIKMLGIPLGVVLIVCLIYYSLRSIYLCRYISDHFVWANCFIVLSVCIASVNEAYMWGVNQPVTTLFFIALATIESKAYNLNSEN